ncbi:hypothetical protein Ancab_034247, partial [Ancistrocladus abbreviatus]
NLKDILVRYASELRHENVFDRIDIGGGLNRRGWQTSPEGVDLEGTPQSPLICG